MNIENDLGMVNCLQDHDYKSKRRWRCKWVRWSKGSTLREGCAGEKCGIFTEGLLRSARNVLCWSSPGQQKTGKSQLPFLLSVGSGEILFTFGERTGGYMPAEVFEESWKLLIIDFLGWTALMREVYSHDSDSHVVLQRSDSSHCLC